MLTQLDLHQVLRVGIEIWPWGEGAKYYDLSVCLSVCEHISRTARIFLDEILYGLPMVLARFSYGGVAICYVLPVL